MNALTKPSEKPKQDLTVFDSLTPQERMFAMKFLETYDHRLAAVEAGYSAETGFRLLNRPLLSQFINFLQEDLFQYMVINRAYVQAKLIETLPKLTGEEEVPLVDPKSGASFMARKFHASELVRMLDLMAKHAGYYVPGASKAVQINFNFEALGFVPANAPASITIENGELIDGAS